MQISGTDDIAYRSGQILEFNEIRQQIDNANTSVIKYGAKTGLSKGTIHSDMATSIFQHGDIKYTLRNQLQIHGRPFAEPGDSGALVFLSHGNLPLRVIGVVEGGINPGICLVTPISAVLKRLGLSSPLQMKAFGNVPYEQRTLENMEQRICLLENASESLKSDVKEIKTKLTQQDQKLDTIISFLEKGQTDSLGTTEVLLKCISK
jgi:hypothetical protein